MQGAAGRFGHWPQSWGFDHWWGFLSGAAGQYDPTITQDNSVLGVPQGKDGNKAPYAFTGTVKEVVFDLKPATHEDEKALHEHAQMQAVGHGAAGREPV